MSSMDSSADGIYSNYESVIAIDGKDFIRSNPKTSFRAVIGVAAKFCKPREFAEEYPKIIAKLKKDYNIDTELMVLKSYRIMSELGKSRGTDFMDEYFDAVNRYISEFTVYFTTIPSTKIPAVKKYGRDKGGVESMPPVEFLKELSNSYPHCCAWKNLRDNKIENGSLLLLDFFQGEITRAWDELKSFPHVRIGTDETNPFIATADILTKLVDNRLYVTKGGLNMQDIRACFKQREPKVVFLDDLEFIVPIRRDKIDFRRLLLHPAVFILKEGIESKTMGEATERNIIELSPAFQKILNFASSRNAYYKFFNAKTDMNLVRDGDYFVYFGENSMKSGIWLKALGYKINVVGINELAAL